MAYIAIYRAIEVVEPLDFAGLMRSELDKRLDRSVATRVKRD